MKVAILFSLILAICCSTAEAQTKSLGFDGQDDYVSMTPFAPAATTFSVEAWVKTTQLGTGYVTGNNDTNDLKVSNGKAECAWFDDVSVGTVTSATTVKTGQWFHIVSTRNGTAIKIYINGVLDGSATIGASAYNHGVTNLGRRGSAENYFKGLSNGVAIWDKALSAGEVTTQYNGAYSSPRARKQTSLLIGN